MKPEPQERGLGQPTADAIAASRRAALDRLQRLESFLHRVEPQKHRLPQTHTAAALRALGAKFFAQWVESGSLAALAASTRLDARAREIEARNPSA